MAHARDRDEEVAIFLQAIRMDGKEETVRLTRVDLEAPWRWLAAGWSDLAAMPHISLPYGAVFAALAVALWFGLSSMGWQSLMLALAGGFMLIGPILAVGLYEASRRRELGETPRLGVVTAAGLRSPGQLSLLGLALLLVFLLWVQLAFLMFMMFFGDRPFPPMDDFVPRLLFTWQGVTLLVIGTAVGAALAAFVFSMTVISVPMLLGRPVSAATAVLVSFNAVVLNIKPMALWAALIAGFSAAGLATLAAGMIVIFPLIGHASWHAYKDIAGGCDEEEDRPKPLGRFH